MHLPSQSKNSIADVIELKKSNRERLVEAIRRASPEALDAAAQQLRETMRRPEGSDQRRKRIAPPALNGSD